MTHGDNMKCILFLFDLPFCPACSPWQLETPASTSQSSAGRLDFALTLQNPSKFHHISPLTDIVVIWMGCGCLLKCYHQSRH